MWVRNQTLSCILCFSLSRLQSRCQPRVCGFLWRRVQGRAFSKLSSRPSASQGCQLGAQVPAWMLTRGHPQFLATWASPVRKAASPKWASQECNTKATNFWNFIAEVTSHYLCYILLIQVKSLGSDNENREWSTQGVKTRSGIIGAMVKPAFQSF